mmetsp:Transcript_21136/g.58245  ORF Transcript_21136/g.58245 Transcript_21136/m.58245 type:complete len:234 (-) Transcript_21136:60-761(-)
MIAKNRRSGMFIRGADTLCKTKGTMSGHNGGAGFEVSDGAQLNCQEGDIAASNRGPGLLLHEGASTCTIKEFKAQSNGGPAAVVVGSLCSLEITSSTLIANPPAAKFRRSSHRGVGAADAGGGDENDGSSTGEPFGASPPPQCRTATRARGRARRKTTGPRVPRVQCPRMGFSPQTCVSLRSAGACGWKGSSPCAELQRFWHTPHLRPRGASRRGAAAMTASATALFRRRRQP